MVMPVTGWWLIMDFTVLVVYTSAFALGVLKVYVMHMYDTTAVYVAP